MATAISLAAAPQPSASPSAVLEAIEARQKLQVAIEDQKRKREAAEVELARNFASSARAAPVVDVEAAFQGNTAWKAADGRSQERLDALQSLLEKVCKLIDQLKVDDPDAAYSALHTKLESLEKALLEEQAEEKDLKDQIKQLKAEISGLQKYTAKKE